jgi:hypothetical protein
MVDGRKGAPVRLQWWRILTVGTAAASGTLVAMSGAFGASSPESVPTSRPPVQVATVLPTTSTLPPSVTTSPPVRVVTVVLKTSTGSPGATTQAAPAAPRHGCPVPDLSGTGGCLTPAMGLLMVHVIGTFGDLPVSCWDRRDGDPFSDHPRGQACDYTMGRIGHYAGEVDIERGWRLATWFRANAGPLHVNYVIWQGQIWSRAYDALGWRPYTGGGRYPTSGPTNGHYDHVHVSTLV